MGLYKETAAEVQELRERLVQYEQDYRAAATEQSCRSSRCIVVFGQEHSWNNMT